ncbi:glutathione S-transferase family protein [Thiothrix nivea]|uniref:glutathione transferase n=1 Tax=Thiothrix nivea (strain ATCC 35100 / DSM 5205 / JP2) TaxID=870187 RepID=A0A656HBG0_THINJ|nr:glutathione S-transferase family protein [Thiothrix nivea]EIJ34461.1 Glutathione S-transferase domain-containing protein [Thiothrix nivea DSM 5205]
MSQPNKLELVSFKVCPFVQRSVIALNEKGVAYTLTHINPHEPPDWFSAISPLGKVPVLLVDGKPLFESAVILEYLDEVYPPSLHPADPLQKAQHRAWVEFCSELVTRQFHMLSAKDAAAFDEAYDSLRNGLQRVGGELAAAGPFFAGSSLQLVDCVYAPLFMRLALVKKHFGVDLQMSERMQVWSDALLAQEAVKTSVVEDFEDVFLNFVKMREGYLLER